MVDLNVSWVRLVIILHSLRLDPVIIRTDTHWGILIDTPAGTLLSSTR
jgi:hypothetical protein